MIRLRNLFAVLMVVSLPASAQAASFSCEKAATPDEKAVCASLPLNDLDVELAVRFDILKSLLAMGNRAQLQDDQEAWLKERGTCAADTACLRQVYETRLKVLRGVFAEFAKQGPQ